MPLFILGAIVIVCCVVYIIAVDYPELFTGERSKARSRGFDYGGGEEEPVRAEKDEPKVIYLPQSPEDIEAEKARRSKKKK